MPRPAGLKVCLLAVVVVAANALPAMSDVTLVENAQPRAAIFVAERVMKPVVNNPASPISWDNLSPESQRMRLQDSVRDLAGILQRVTGAKIDVVAGSPKAGETRVPILIGELAVEKFGKPQKSAEYGQGLRVVVKGNTVGLLGESDLGTSYAIYTLLDKLGCKWYMPTDKGEVLPSLKTLTLKDQDYSDAPYTICRRVIYTDADFARRNRMGGMFLAAGHNLEFAISKEFRAKHPEIKAIIGGKPNDLRLKWSSPLVAQELARVTLDLLKKNPYLGSYSLSPEDGMNWDESDDTKLDAGDFDPANQAVSKTDRLMVLANRVAAIVRPKHPNFKFGILAYVDYTRPPVREKVDPMVIPQIAPIAFTRAHPMNDPNEPNNKTLQGMVEGWAKVVPATSYYFYGYNLAETATPNPMLTKWGHDVGYVIAKGNCRYWQPETIANFESCLHAHYMANRLAWDPKEKPTDIYAEIHDKFYGHAGKQMAAYWQAMDDMWVKTPEYSGCGFGHLRRFTPERLAAARKLMNAAVAACQTDAEKYRVAMAEKSFAGLELFMKLRRDLAEGRFASLASDADTYMKTQNLLGQQYKPQFAFGNMYWTGENTISTIYFKEFYKYTYDDATKVAQKFEIVTNPPVREWKYQIDPDKKGEAAGWAKPNHADSSWKTTDCAVETWSSLNFHNYMKSMWYRTQVKLPEIPPGKKIHLWIGATDGRVKVFVNGQHVNYVNDKGVSEPTFGGYCRPASFDITSVVKNGGENQISLFCTREAFNEAGTGGLIAPVVIYRDR